MNFDDPVPGYCAQTSPRATLAQAAASVVSGLDAPALALALLVFGSWQLVTLIDFTRSIFQRIPALFS